MNNPIVKASAPWRTPKATLAILSVGLLAIGGGCVALQEQAGPRPLHDSPTNYVIVLGDGINSRVKWKSEKQFNQALNLLGDTEWHSLISVNQPSPSGLPQISTIPAKPQVSPPPVISTSYVYIYQTTSTNGVQPCTSHVTQKVGVNTLTQVKAVLDALQP